MSLKSFKNCNFFAYISIILCGFFLSFSTQTIGIAPEFDSTTVQRQDDSDPSLSLSNDYDSFINESIGVTPQELYYFYPRQKALWQQSISPNKDKALELLAYLEENEILHSYDDAGQISVEKIFPDAFKIAIHAIIRGKSIASEMSKCGELFISETGTSLQAGNMIKLAAGYMQINQQYLPYTAPVQNLLLALYLREFCNNNPNIQKKNTVFLVANGLLPNVDLHEDFTANSEENHSEPQGYIQKMKNFLWKHKLVIGAAVMFTFTTGGLIYKYCRANKEDGNKKEDGSSTPNAPKGGQNPGVTLTAKSSDPKSSSDDVTPGASGGTPITPSPSTPPANTASSTPNAPPSGGPSEGGPSAGGPSVDSPSEGGPSAGGPSVDSPSEGGPSVGGPGESVS